jgi:hypothetical protein
MTVTLASSTIINDIENMRKCGLASLAMFFHDFRDIEKQDLRGLLSSVLVQLCGQSDSYHDILSLFYSTHCDGHHAQSPSNDDLLRCLKDLLQLPGQAPVYLIIDALDECPKTSTTVLPSPREEILEALTNLFYGQLPNLRGCITSLPEPDIKAALDPLTFHSVPLHDESGQREDIANYVRSIIDMHDDMQLWSPELSQHVVKVLTERADGRYDTASDNPISLTPHSYIL